MEGFEFTKSAFLSCPWECNSAFPQWDWDRAQPWAAFQAAQTCRVNKPWSSASCKCSLQLHLCLYNGIFWDSPWPQLSVFGLLRELSPRCVLTFFLLQCTWIVAGPSQHFLACFLQVRTCLCRNCLLCVVPLSPGRG